MEATVKQKKTPSLFPVLLAAFIDMVGIGIVIPVIAPLIIDNGTGIVPASFSPLWRDIILGLLLTSYPLAQFFGAPLLGSLSDRYGRKPLLFLALLGSSLGYVIFAIGVVTNDLALVFVGRLLDGITGGNISIVYSSIADVSTPANRTRNFGLVGALFGLGFIVGPALGGILANPEYVSWFSPATPFWVAAGLCLFNAVLVAVMFRETLKEKNPAKINAFTGFRNVGVAFRMPKLKTLFWVLLASTVGFAFFTSFFSVLMIKKFDYNESDIGWLFFFVGIWIAVVQGGLIKPISKRFSTPKVLQFGALLLTGVFVALLFPDREWMIFALMPVLAFAQGMFGPFITSFISQQASDKEQGMVMGVTQSVNALGNAIPPLLAGILSSFDYHLPIVAAAVFTLLGFVIFRLFYKGAY
jgi:DHA1 family tetracycline resistance protein-like MFS transporter